jgi:hypothetical protein
MQTELENRGTLVGSMDGIWSAHLSSGVGFAWNVGGSIRPLTGGGCAAPLWRLRYNPCLSFLQGERIWRVEIVGYKSVIP